LTSKWRGKTTTIEESKDILKYAMQELMGNLAFYEVQLKVEEDLVLEVKKKKEIAFLVDLDGEPSIPKGIWDAINLL
jgi:hypothetical protein